MLRASSILFLAHARRGFLSRRAALCLGLVLLPVAVAWLIARFAEGEDQFPVGGIGYLLVLQTIVPIVAVVLGSAVVAEEIEDRTITYLLTRPIPRASILLGRWLATALLATILLVGGAAAVLFVLASAEGDVVTPPPEGFGARLISAVLLGTFAYTALFAAAGTFFKRPVLVGLGYAFAVEGFLSNLPGSGQALTIQYYLKSFLLGDDPELAERYGGWLVRVELVSAPEAVRTLLIVGSVALALGSWLLSRRQFLLTS